MNSQTIREKRMDELNEKMLVFAGFTRHKYRGDVCKHRPKCEHWNFPDGTYCYPSQYPDFPHDTTACFEHLVPKLWAKGFDYELYGWMGNEHKTIIGNRTGHVFQPMSEAIDKEASMAFCKALDKAIR